MPSAIGPDLVYRLVSVGEPSLSLHGSLLAFLRLEADATTGESRSSGAAMDQPDGAVRLLTEGARDTSPRVSPDGTTIAFLREGADKHRQLFTVPSDGGDLSRTEDF